MTHQDHTRPMIENSDRGITLNKPLAWTMLVTLAGLIWFGASTVSSLQSSVESLTAAKNRTESTIGLVAVWCRTFDSVMCSKGDEPWAQSGGVVA